MSFDSIAFIQSDPPTQAEADAASDAVADIRAGLSEYRTFHNANSTDDFPPLPTGCGPVTGASPARIICMAICEIRGLMGWLKCVTECDPVDWADCVDSVQDDVDACCDDCSTA